MIETISLDDCLQLTYQYPGLVVGPSATSHVAGMSELRKRIVDHIAPGVIPEKFTDYFTISDFVKREYPDRQHSVTALVRKFFSEISASPSVQHLVRGRWSMVVSLTADLHFEDELRARFEKAPSSWTITVVDHPSVVPPAQTIPIFKLLGNNRDSRIEHTLAVSTSELMRRHLNWRKMLPGVADFLRDAPLFFVGTETIIPMVRDFLNELYSGGPPYPTRLVFLRHDPVLDDPAVYGLVAGFSKLSQVDTTLRDFCEATAQVNPSR